MKNELTEQNEKDLCNIILNGNAVHKNITKYLRDHNLQRSSSKGGFIKDLIKRLIEPYVCDCMKYKLQIHKYNKKRNL